MKPLASRPRFIRFGINQQIFFARRLSLYLQSGIPITKAFSLIIEDTQSHSSLYVYEALRETVTSGLPLSSGLSKFPKQFNSFFVGFVRAGEVSGTLADTLERLADISASRATLYRKILSALIYPAIIFFGTISIAFFLTLFIFPKIIPILRGFKSTLPFSTRILIWINDLITHDWFFLIFGFIFFISCLLASLRSKRIRKFLEKLLLHVPVFSQLYRYYAVAVFSRTFSIQLKGGVRILTALSLVRSAVPGSLYSEAIEMSERTIAEGQRFSDTLRQHSDLFPLIVCQMIAAGEVTGTLANNLETIADLYEDNLDELAKNLTTLIEPVLMIVMGFVVGFIALAIITPIYAVTQNLNLK